MAVFELIIALLLAGAVLAAWARRVQVPYPALLALAGASLALLPDAPSISLDPELALALFVAPVLLDAAFDASPRDLRREWRAVTSLVLIAVGLTVAAVAVVARWLVPGMPLAAAVALPVFPHRAFILFTAFSVVLVTLVVQGMTVSPLMRLLRLRDDGSVEAEVRLARTETLRAGLGALEGSTDQGDAVTFLRRKYAARLARAEAGDAPPDRDDGWAGYTAALHRAQAVQRRTLSNLRARGVIGDDAFHRVEEELDWAEVEAETRQQSAEQS